MEAKQETWQIWSEGLQHWGLRHWAISFLEACGPFTILAAQLFYLGQPFFSLADSQGRLGTLVNMLENTSETKEFIRFLQESAQK